MLTEQSIRLPNGVTLRYVEQGPAGATPIILLHGFPDSWLAYEPVLAHMPKSVRAIALSQRGFGNSDKPAAGYHPRDLAADLAEFMKRQNVPPAVVVGHSMGALVAQRFALDFPDRVAGLVLIGTFKSQAGNAELLEMIASLEPMEDPIYIELVRFFQASTLARPVPEEFFATVVSEGARLPLRIWRSALKEIVAYDDLAELSGISVPTILCWGDRDGFSTLEQQQELARAMPGGELRVYPGAGHSPHWEEPKRFAAEFAGFMSVLAKRQAEALARA